MTKVDEQRVGEESGEPDRPASRHQSNVTAPARWQDTLHRLVSAAVAGAAVVLLQACGGGEQHAATEEQKANPLWLAPAVASAVVSPETCDPPGSKQVERGTISNTHSGKGNICVGFKWGFVDGSSCINFENTQTESENVDFEFYGQCPIGGGCQFESEVDMKVAKSCKVCVKVTQDRGFTLKVFGNGGSMLSADGTEICKTRESSDKLRMPAMCTRVQAEQAARGLLAGLQPSMEQLCLEANQVLGRDIRISNVDHGQCGSDADCKSDNWYWCQEPGCVKRCVGVGSNRSECRMFSGPGGECDTTQYWQFPCDRGLTCKPSGEYKGVWPFRTPVLKCS